MDQVSAVMNCIQAGTGLVIPAHVDGASGTMAAPLLQSEVWDFRLSRVAFINTSGLK